MNSQPNVRQTRSRTRAQQENANLNPGAGDEVASMSSRGSFIPSMVDDDGGEFHDCAGCDRPNKSERYMVQCQSCDLWYHFTCAKVNTDTVRTCSFVCVVCTSSGVSGAAERTRTPSLVSGASGTSSARKSRIELELRRLEEEKKLLEDLNRERIEKERALNERELQEKLERGKQFIARKHELLSQQDGDGGRSVRSMRSSQRSAKRTEDWVMQSKATGCITDDAVPPVRPPMTAIEDRSENALLENPQEAVHPSSTPLRSTTSVAQPIVEETELEVQSIPQTLESITIDEESSESVDGTVGVKQNQPEADKNSDELPLVNLQPFADLLKVEVASGSNIGQVSKINRFGAGYQRWSIETGELRKQKALQLQNEATAERQTVQYLLTKHRVDIDARRKREIELVERIKSLQLQHEKDLKVAHESEASLRASLQQMDRERTAFQTQLESLKKLLAEEKERNRQSESAMQMRLDQRTRECEALELQRAELECEIQSLREMDRQMQSQLEVARHHENEATRLRKEAEKEYWDLHDEVQKFVDRNKEKSSDGTCSPTLPPPPASWSEPLNVSGVGTSDPLPPPPNVGGFPNGQQQFGHQLGAYETSMRDRNVPVAGTHPQVPCGLIPATTGGPSPQQLAARQVVTRELPSFAGDPIDWPLFISSYQHSTDACGYSNSENLLRLQRSLKGSAKDSVSSFLLHPSTVPQVLSTLQQLYGRPEQIVNNMIAKVRATPPPKPDRLETLISFGLVVQNLCGHLKAVGLERHLANPILLQELVDKLPSTVKFSWALYQEQVPVVDLNAFSMYMAKVSSAASGVTQLAGNTQKPLREERNRTKEKSFVNAHISTEQPTGNRRADVEKSGGNSGMHKVRESGSKTCAVCQVDSHHTGNCTSFKGMDLDGRWKIVKVHKLCARCLTSHTRWPCKGDVCGINECPKRHHRLLHFEAPTTSKPTNGVVSIHRQLSSSTLFRILPVTVFGPKGEVNTYAFLDDGSSVTLVEQSIADALGISGKQETLHIEWTGGINQTISGSNIITMEIAEAGGNKRFKLSDAYTVRNLGLPQQTTDYAELVTRYPHLNKLPIKSFRSATPAILIGQSNSHLLATLKLREGKLNEPIATKTRIGWTVCGSLRKPQSKSVHRQLHMYAEPTVDLHEYVRRFFDIESLGVAVAPNVKGTEEQRAQDILTATTRRSNDGSNKFETGLLWKHDYVEFPESRPMAERRFKCLERRLSRDPQLYDCVRRQIAEFQTKGYIHEATMEEIESFDLRRTWFLPIGIVVNEKKPGKVRVIWDAASKVDGVSLNSMLLKGPQLLTPLLSVMFPYRERQVAVSADIKEMFLQILIREEDRSALLFPYRDSPELPMRTMVSDVAIFGAACSPAHSQYIKNVNATEQEPELPRGAAAVKQRHYVDDYVDSFDSAEEAFEVAKEVIEVHKRAGFYIRNWMSSDKSVLEKLGEAITKPSKVMLPEKENGFERVLGMAWMQEDDIFTFSLQFCDNLRTFITDCTVPTKREMLRLVMSIYDPLGLIGSIVVHGKIVIQEVWRTAIDWDSKIPMEIAARWTEWIAVLKQIERLRIPRCYFPGYDPQCLKHVELHVFVDASAQAFAAVAYFRIIDRGQIRVALVSSKTKVAPLRGLSIPRLELMAAVLGARLRKTIEENHTLKVQKTCFWSDSSTVCSWIKSDTRRYRQFVAFRVNEILSLSSVDEWQWISTKVNVADEATKWGKGPSCSMDSRWFQGPEFLYDTEANWLMVPDESTDESDKELRETFICSHLVRQPIVDAERFSRYERLVRSVAYVHHFVDSLRTSASAESTDTRGLTSLTIQKAERTLWLTAQSAAFPEEAAILKQNSNQESDHQKQICSTSRLVQLSPFADDFGVLRVGTRAAEARVLTYDAKFPIILPRSHRITELMLDFYHRKYAHANDETIVNEVRQKFYVPRLRVEVRLTRKRCMWCRVYKSTPVAPKMGPLPAVRLEPYVRPFTYVGIDLCGPYLVKVGRSVAKRWVCLFTCLTVRAIHLEVVASLSTDACKKAIRRFVARRGSPKEIYSDNGTNFVGASRELHDEIKRIHTDLGSTFTNAQTQWRFNPPAAPHMGGCWERMVRAVKAALGSVPVVRKLDDESFATVLVEAESMVNSRPLTFIPLETADQESLTPNHFLMLSSNGVKEPEKFPTEEGVALKNSWSMVKHTLDNFWRRWVVEYLPTIIRRTKWFQDVKPIKVGDLVFVIDENVRNRWMRGRVIHTVPGKDGVVRKAEVQTTNGILKRPATKLAVLDVLSSGDDQPEVSATRRGGCSPQQPLVADTHAEIQWDPISQLSTMTGEVGTNR